MSRGAAQWALSSTRTRRRRSRGSYYVKQSQTFIVRNKWRVRRSSCITSFTLYEAFDHRAERARRSTSGVRRLSGQRIEFLTFGRWGRSQWHRGISGHDDLGGHVHVILFIDTLKSNTAMVISHCVKESRGPRFGPRPRRRLRHLMSGLSWQRRLGFTGLWSHFLDEDGVSPTAKPRSHTMWSRWNGFCV